ncbi:MAG: hypothetical protein QXO01_06580 [Nitrososphaerota archaeon]
MENGRIQWIKSPWRVLFDVTNWDKLRVWEVNLKELLSSLAMVLKERGFFDFTSSGVAVYSAATLHRLKSERLLVADDVPIIKQKQEYLIPPPLSPPLRAEFMTTTILELIDALKRVLSEPQPRKQDSVEQQSLNVEDFIIKIEEKVEEFYNFIKGLLERKGTMTLDEIMSGIDRLEAVRRFILLLFAASKGMVTIIEDDGGRVLISLGESYG